MVAWSWFAFGFRTIRIYSSHRMRRGRFLKAVNKSQFPSSCIYPIDLILAILILLYWSVQTGLALPEDICDLSFSDSITKMLSIVREANQNEFSAALAFKLSLLKTHIFSPVWSDIQKPLDIMINITHKINVFLVPLLVDVDDVR